MFADHLQEAFDNAGSTAIGGAEYENAEVAGVVIEASKDSQKRCVDAAILALHAAGESPAVKFVDQSTLRNELRIIVGRREGSPK